MAIERRPLVFDHVLTYRTEQRKTDWQEPLGLLELFTFVQEPEEESAGTLRGALFGLEKWAAENPDGGIEQDFSIQVLGVTANSSMLFVAINRLGVPVIDVSFVYSLGLRSGEWIWNRVRIRIHLSDDQVGVIMPDRAMPFLIDLSPEQEALFDRMTESNQAGRWSSLHMIGQSKVRRGKNCR